MYGVEEGRRRGGTLLVVMFLTGSLTIVFVCATFAGSIPPGLVLPIQSALLGSTLVGVIVCSLCSPWRAYRSLAVALLAAAGGMVLATHAGDWSAALLGGSHDTPAGFTALKIGEDAAIVGVILLVFVVARERLGLIYLQRGRLALGLRVGLIAFSVCGMIGALSLTPAGDRMIVLVPMGFAIALADGFTEELLFRGLFLRCLEPVVGRIGANVATAAVFGLGHLQADFVMSAWLFVAVTFILGLIWGELMQRTDSIIAPWLTHAAVDLLVINDMFAAFARGAPPAGSL